MLQNNYTLSYFYKCVHIVSLFNHNAQKDINNKKYMCHERNIMNTFLKPVYTKYLNTIVHDMYINVVVLYSPILLLILMDMNCTNTLLWSNFLKTLLKRKALLIFL
jgi:hypothetical protein